MDEPVTREWVEQELHRAGFSPQRIDEMLGDIAFPAEYEILAAHLQKVGVTRSALVSKIGGSP